MTTATETKTRKTAAHRPAKTGHPGADRAANAEAEAKAASNGKAVKPEPKAAKPEPTPEPKPKTAQALIREVDQAVIAAAGQLVEKLPAEVRDEVAQAVANQLHHLSTM